MEQKRFTDEQVLFPECALHHDIIPMRRGSIAILPAHSGSVADHLVAGALGKRGQVALLARAGLVGGRDPAVQGGALSQLNSPSSLSDLTRRGCTL